MFKQIELCINQVFKYFNRLRLIKDRTNKKPYLIRYYIFLKERNIFPFNIFIHKFLASDPDDLHDHPWSFISIPIWPGYYEHTPCSRIWRGPFSFKYSNAQDLHRIELYYSYCWTIFIPFKKKRDWGFETKKGWIYNEEYLISHDD